MIAPPLQGLTVLDFGQGVAGPYCGQLLADNGADVIKIEPPRGDWSRTMGENGGVYLSVNRNKRGICLDLRDPGAQRVVQQAARGADIIIESFRPGVMDKLGLGYEQVRAVNSGIVYCSVTGFGDSGPNVRLPAGDSIMQAYGGLMSIIGEREGQPLRVGNMVSDMLAGMNAFSGVLMAVLSRHQCGAGQHIQVSLLDSIIAFQGPPLTEYLLSGKLPERQGNDHPLIAPSGTIRTQDGYISFTVFDHQWPGFCEQLQLAHLLTDARFATSAQRQRHREALKGALEPLFASKTSEQWLTQLRSIDILCAPVNDYASVVADPQVQHNGLIRHVAHENGKTLPMIANPVRSHHRQTDPRPAPRLGEHNVEVLTSMWGCSAQEAERLTHRTS